MSLSARITLGASLILAIFLVLTGLALDRAFRESARSARQDRLEGQLYLLIGAAEVDRHGRLAMPPVLPEARLSQPGSGLYAYITDATGKALWQSASTLGTRAPFQAKLAAGAGLFESRRDAAGTEYFLHSMGVVWAEGGKRHAFTFSISEDLSAYNAQIRHYRRSLWGWLGAMAVLLLLAQMAALRWGLRPLRNAAKELKEIETGQKECLAESYPHEISELTDNLNILLRHERERQKRYRDALSDLAHSLKTPLAVMRGALSEQPRGAPPGSQRSPLAETVDEEARKMERIVDYQLQRAATFGQASKLAAPLAIGPLAARIASSLQKVHRERNLEIRLAIDEGTTYRCDEGDLMELLGNLLDNACKWCRHTVRLGATATPEELLITVEDDGPGIAEAQAEEILQRGIRADQAVPGHGIGLAVVRDIVQAYGGQITVGRSGLGGALFTVRLPLQEHWAA